TYELMISMLEIIEENHEKIALLREGSINNFKEGTEYPLDWQIDTTRISTLKFKGFEGKMITSEVTGSQRLKYDRDKPFTKDVKYQNYFKPS
ncbi:MAG: hypothetical protein KDD23_05780, partial [Winogradskyella sp.]|nr:hypothetical protein [Winogradskyella sp.]